MVTPSTARHPQITPASPNIRIAMLLSKVMVMVMVMVMVIVVLVMVVVTTKLGFARKNTKDTHCYKIITILL